jgi:hypothetical protein
MRPTIQFVAATLILLCAFLWLSACAPAALPNSVSRTSTPFQPYQFTPTAFLPIHPTFTPIPDKPKPTYQFHGIDFTDSQSWIEISILPIDESVNRGRPIRVRFKPGNDCAFGSWRACVTSYLQEDDREVIFLSIHSGVTGQAQSYRHAVEGTGINQAGFTLEETLQNLQTLRGASVSIRQNNRDVNFLSLVDTARVPASSLQAYFALPVSQAMQSALPTSQLSPGNQPILVFETCGWHMPGESRADAVNSTTASIYLAVIE